MTSFSLFDKKERKKERLINEIIQIIWEVKKEKKKKVKHLLMKSGRVFCEERMKEI